MGVELLRARRLDRGQHHWQVLGLAPCEHGVDRHLLNRALDEVRRDDSDDVVGGTARAQQHLRHALGCRRHDRQPVGPSSVEHGLGVVLGLGQFDAARAQRFAGKTGGDIGLDGARSAAGGVIGQALAEAPDPRERLPRVALPPDDPLAVFDQRRDGLNAQGERGPQPLVVVLSMDRELGFSRQPLEDGLDQPARRAVLLHDRDQHWP